MDALLEILLVLTGKVLVHLLSFGRWRGEALANTEARIYSAAGGLSFVREGRRVVTVAGLTLIGMAFYGLVLTGVFVALSS
ncbi:hypothetical protein QTH87_06520 [Variovorax sp. J22P168]|uniref:hypothetical protein n=1 Tax=Variovorax jilinensis TaxID=3053513 RepID=UPI00257750EE|nr:hypothetical protein [Variovorax sp. J22P168]MDM0012093.1 hypothetical protein [Variovorax sp. J22P168]